mmetsp:Transcript_4349/g.9016  ORF Transcript_4349/g.9016 Transcript_4349/m.9016 type:complete len:969 (-) Transcript_4349:59-2965(-)
MPPSTPSSSLLASLAVLPVVLGGAFVAHAFSPSSTLTHHVHQIHNNNSSHYFASSRASTSKSTSKLTALSLASENDETTNQDNEQGKSSSATTKNKPRKGRRFTQQIHPSVAAALSKGSSGGGAAATKKKRISQSSTTSKKNVETSNSSSSSNDSNYNPLPPPPLQTSKSIEELEAILEKRWGTAPIPSSTALVSKPRNSNNNDGDGDNGGETAFYSTFKKGKEARSGRTSRKRRDRTVADEDADFVISFGEESDEYEYEDVGAGNLKGGAAAVIGKDKDGAVKGRRPVLDPWAKEEGLYDDEYDDDDNEEVSYDAALNPNAVVSRAKQEEALLKRVRANQQRLQKSKTVGRYNSDYDDSEDDDGDDVYNIPIDNDREYYDEDDEGYETTSGASTLLSPRPVGGKGKGGSNVEFSTTTSSLTGGIFSDRLAATARRKNENVNGDSTSSKENKQTEDKKKKKRNEKKESQPIPPAMLDENGNEMFLTLEQAQRFVNDILSSSDDNNRNENGNDSFATTSSNTQWKDLGITHPTLLSNLNSRTMTCPTPLPVQEKACPPIVAGNDVLVSTHTGSGKTLAFLAPMAQNLLVSTSTAAATQSSPPSSSTAYPKAIILAPGRELASQIFSVAQTLFLDTGLTAAMAIGGTTYSRNVENLRKKKPDVVVGTPGRIAELVVGRVGDKSGKLKISGLQTVVLDEFDALLQYDAHKEPTMAIMEVMNRQHGQSLQRIFCSATATDMLIDKEDSSKQSSGNEKVPSNILEQYLRPGYAHASVDEDDLLVTSGVTRETRGGAVRTSARVSRTTIHGALHVPHKRFALEALRRVLNTQPIPQQVLVFVDSPRRVDIVIEKLAEMGIIAAPLHGGEGKGDRAEVNKALREGYVGLVVATEMAARGIDAPYLTHVVNMDLPTDASHYAHRAGRCGRGGRPGVALTITTNNQEKGVPKKMAEELGIDMHAVEARGGKLRILQE